MEFQISRQTFAPPTELSKRGIKFCNLANLAKKKVYFAEAGRMQSSWSNNGDLSKTLLMLSQRFAKV